MDIKFERIKDDSYNSGDYQAVVNGIQFKILKANQPRVMFALTAYRLKDDGSLGEDLTNDIGLRWTKLKYCMERAESILAKNT